MEVRKVNRRGFAKGGMAVVALTAFARRGDAKAQQAKEEKKMAGRAFDEFLGDNAPLVTAEIELPFEDTPCTKPDWLGVDVTDDHRYKNNNLAACPYGTWR